MAGPYSKATEANRDESDNGQIHPARTIPHAGPGRRGVIPWPVAVGRLLAIIRIANEGADGPWKWEVHTYSMMQVGATHPPHGGKSPGFMKSATGDAQALKSGHGIVVAWAFREHPATALGGTSHVAPFLSQNNQVAKREMAIDALVHAAKLARACGAHHPSLTGSGRKGSSQTSPSHATQAVPGSSIPPRLTHGSRSDTATRPTSWPSSSTGIVSPSR